MTAARAITIVVPCYNEERRLRPELVQTLAGDQRVRVLLVDDGSSDATATVLAGLAEGAPDGVEWLAMPGNVGK